jgi:tetratricopeptide (TPR) repeat protein
MKDKKEYDKAIENFEKCIEIDKDNVFAYNSLGNIMKEKKECYKAIE